MGLDILFFTCLLLVFTFISFIDSSLSSYSYKMELASLFITTFMNL